MCVCSLSATVTGARNLERSELACCPSVFVKTMVCCGCSFLQAQKNWFCPLLFKDFQKFVSAGKLAHAIAAVEASGAMPFVLQ